MLDLMPPTYAAISYCRHAYLYAPVTLRCQVDDIRHCYYMMLLLITLDAYMPFLPPRFTLLPPRAMLRHTPTPCPLRAFRHAIFCCRHYSSRVSLSNMTENYIPRQRE